MSATLGRIRGASLIAFICAMCTLEAQTSCGDCNIDGVTGILDALAAAQIGAMIVLPTPVQSCSCDVNNDGQVNVLDALRLAQDAAGLFVVFMCPAPTCAGVNQPPVVTILSPTGGTQGGIVTIAFDLDDPDLDLMSLYFEFSSNGGASWLPAVTAGSGLIVGNPASGVAGATALTFDWNSPVQIAVTASVDFRVNADDGMAISIDQSSFIVDNSAPIPFCQVTTPAPGTPAGNITVNWTAVDLLSRTVNIIVEFSVDGGLSWEQCTEGAGSSGTSMLTSAPPPGGSPHVFVWVSPFDGVGLTSPETAILQFTISTGSVGSICVTSPFTVDNR